MQLPRVFTHPCLVLSLFALLCAAGLAARAGGVVSDCTETALRAALAGGGMVTFSCSGTITVTNTVIITTPTVIDGTGQQVVLSGGGAVRVISNQSTTELRWLTIANGRDTSVGGVFNSGTLTASDCTFRDNVTPEYPTNSFPNYGAGALASYGTLSLERCAFVDNRSESLELYVVAALRIGYPISIYPAHGPSSVVNCTFSGNSTVSGTIVNAGHGNTVPFEHCTFAGNTGPSLFSDRLVPTMPPQARIRACAFGLNTGENVSGNAVEDAGYNISADFSARLNHPTSVLGMDPLLGPLADNGGPTPTFMPQAGSPLIDNALYAGTLALDQRGVGRPQGFARDVGAVEVENASGVDIFRLTANAVTLEESASSLSVTVTRSGIATNTASVRLFTEDGTAHAGSDYTALDVVLDFQPGQVSRTVTVPVLNDTEVEPVEGFLVRLGPPGDGSLLGNAQLAVTLNSEEMAIRFASATRVVMENQGVVALGLVREGDTRNPVSATPVRLGGTALAGSDYNLSTAAVTFAPNSTNATLTLSLLNNTSHEEDETLVVGLNVTAANTRVISPTNLVVTIQDDDPVVPGTLGFATNSVRVAEGSGSALLRVTRTVGTNGVVSVSYTTAAVGGAAEGGDFVATSGTLQFEEYETQKVIEIPLVVDATAEPDESFQVVLSAPGGGAGLGTTTVNIQIQDTPRTLLFCDQASIEAAVTVGGTIRFACDGTITFDHRIPILQGVLLDANGHNVVLTAATNGFFQVTAGATLDLRGLTLSGGRALGATGTASNGLVPGVRGGPGRGGAATVERAVLRASDCQFLDNQARAGAGGSDFVSLPPPGQGGAVHGRESILEFQRCRFEDNLARGGDILQIGAGGYLGGPGGGGALHATNSFVRLNGCHLEGNQVESGQGGRFNNGLFGGGATDFEMCLVEMERSEFVRNIAEVPWGIHAQGGAVRLDSRSNGSIRMCRFYANRVKGGNGIYPTVGTGRGEGAALRNAGRIVLEACTFDQNEAVSGFNTQLAGIMGAGGGVWNSGWVDARNCTFHRNKARGGDDTHYSFQADGYGGGLYNQGGWVEVLNCTWVDNAAEPSHPSMPSNHLGGAIYNTNGTVRVENSVFDGNLPGGSLGGGIQDLGYNLADDAAGFTHPTSLNLTDPLTGPLADLGGPVPTIYLLPGSPARDVAGVTHFPPTDANGLARPQGSGCDLGAVEHPAGAVISGVVRGVGFSRAVPVVVQVGSAVSRPLESGVYAAFVPSSGVYRVTLADPDWVFEPNTRDVDASGHAPDMDFSAHRFAHVHLAPPSTSGSTLTYAAASNQSVRVLFSPDVHPAAWTSLGDFTTDANGVLRLPVDTSSTTGTYQVTVP